MQKITLAILHSALPKRTSANEWLGAEGSLGTVTRGEMDGPPDRRSILTSLL